MDQIVLFIKPVIKTIVFLMMIFCCFAIFTLAFMHKNKEQAWLNKRLPGKKSKKGL